MPSFATTYTCSACNSSFPVEIVDLGDPHRHIPESSQRALRGLGGAGNHVGGHSADDPVEELAQRLLEQEARSELRYAICPKCSARNPDGIAADKAEQRRTMIFGLGFFGIIAVVAYFYPYAALLLPGIDLLVFRPMMFVMARKNPRPFPVLTFLAGIALDIALIAVIFLYPRAAPIVPLAGILQSLLGKSKKNDWTWDEAQKKIRFGTTEEAAS